MVLSPGHEMSPATDALCQNEIFWEKMDPWFLTKALQCSKECFSKRPLVRDQDKRRQKKKKQSCDMNDSGNLSLRDSINRSCSAEHFLRTLVTDN